jgi:hypothetical protein
VMMVHMAVMIPLEVAFAISPLTAPMIGYASKDTLSSAMLQKIGFARVPRVTSAPEAVLIRMRPTHAPRRLLHPAFHPHLRPLLTLAMTALMAATTPPTAVSATSPAATRTTGHAGAKKATGAPTAASTLPRATHARCRPSNRLRHL